MDGSKGERVKKDTPVICSIKKVITLKGDCVKSSNERKKVNQVRLSEKIFFLRRNVLRKKTLSGKAFGTDIILSDTV